MIFLEKDHTFRCFSYKENNTGEKTRAFCTNKMILEEKAESSYKETDLGGKNDFSMHTHCYQQLFCKVRLS